jgi:hypothetical protein
MRYYLLSQVPFFSYRLLFLQIFKTIIILLITLNLHV